MEYVISGSLYWSRYMEDRLYQVPYTGVVISEFVISVTNIRIRYIWIVLEHHTAGRKKIVRYIMMRYMKYL